MPATLTSPARVPFDHELFYYAMKGLLEREPDNQSGHDGFCEYIYKPANDAEQKKFEESAQRLWVWLDKYDITFSRSICEFSDSRNWGVALIIMVRYPIIAAEPKRGTQ